MYIYVHLCTFMYIVEPDLMVTGLPSGTFIFDLPIEKSVFFSIAMLVYQRVMWVKQCHKPSPKLQSL